MKRRSEIMYTSPSSRTEFLLHPDFNFDKTLPRLVDYSVSDSSDSDDLDETRTQFDKSVDNLKSSLEALGTPVPYLEACLRRKVLKKSMSRNLRERISMRLKAEKEAEMERNNRLIKMMAIEEVLNTTRIVCEGERPAKRMRLDTNLFRRFSPRRMSFLKKNRKRRPVPLIVDVHQKKSLFSFLNK